MIDIRWAVGASILLILSACMSQDEMDATGRNAILDAPAPVYFRDELANKCFVDFPNQSYVQPMETECTEETLRAISVQSQMKDAGR